MMRGQKSGQPLARRAAVAIAALMFLFGAAAATTALEVPALTGRVNDLASILSSQAERDITGYLAGVEDASGAQIAVLTIPSLEGDSLEDFSIRVVDQWKLGSADGDNGVLLLIARAEKKIRIEVGYGLEGELTDAKSGLIIRQIIQPRFQSGDYDGGVAAAVQAIGGVVTGNAEIVARSGSATAQRDNNSAVGIPFNFVVFLIVLSLGSFGRRRRYGSFGRAMMWGVLLGNSGGRRGGGFSSGGGFGGGSFGGGGGGFGGGGASGGW